MIVDSEQRAFKVELFEEIITINKTCNILMKQVISY